MEAFYRTHNYLVEHTNAPVRRDLMDEIDWNDRLIGIKGTRGVGKTTFLLQYAKEKFGTDRSCLFVNMNNFYFSQYSLVDFAGEFVKRGGKVLLIDQVFKLPDWSHDLRTCYERYPQLKIVFTGSSVMRLKDENPELNGIVKSYNLRGFSFREFLNLQTGNHFSAYTLDEILHNHEHIVKTILPHINPLNYFQDYIHHGFYPLLSAISFDFPLKFPLISLLYLAGYFLCPFPLICLISSVQDIPYSPPAPASQPFSPHRSSGFRNTLSALQAAPHQKWPVSLPPGFRRWHRR